MLVPLPSPQPQYLMRRIRNRRKQCLMMTAFVLDTLDGDNNAKPSLKGRLLGSKNIRRTQKAVEGMWKELGGYARKAYQTIIDAFNFLHETLEDELKEEFVWGEGA